MEFELHPSQKQIVLDRHRFRIVNCGRKFGKTTLSREELQGAGLSHDDARVLYIAPTYGEARDIMWEPLKRLTRPAWVSEPNETRQEISIRSQDGGKSLIYLKGWEAIESVRGMEFDFIVADEIRKYRSFWIGWNEVIRPTLTPRKGELLGLSTPNGFDHFYDLCMLYKTDPEYQYFHFTSYDNPHLDREELETAKRQLPEDQFAQEYLADFRKRSGLVYREFNREVHVVNVVPHYRVARILGIDFGYTNPSAVLTIDVDEEGYYWITEEWYKTGKTNIEIIEYAKSKQPNVVYADPAEPDRIEEMRRHNLNMRDVSKDISPGVDRVREFFKSGKIKVNASCVNLISELESYSYPDKKDDKNYEERPIKDMDHAVDALRYALFMYSPGVSNVAVTYKPKLGGSSIVSTDPRVQKALTHRPKW